jgi:hypothetical protein
LAVSSGFTGTGNRSAGGTGFGSSGFGTFGSRGVSTGGFAGCALGSAVVTGSGVGGSGGVGGGGTVASDFFDGLDFWRHQLPSHHFQPWLIYGGDTRQARERGTALPWSDLGALLEALAPTR